MAVELSFILLQGSVLLSFIVSLFPFIFYFLFFGAFGWQLILFSWSFGGFFLGRWEFWFSTYLYYI